MKSIKMIAIVAAATGFIISASCCAHKKYDGYSQGQSSDSSPAYTGPLK